jgi:hypothetical protein
MGSLDSGETPPLTSQVDARIELERLSTNDKPKHWATAHHWRSMALLAELATTQTTEVKISDFLFGAAWGAIAALGAILIFLGFRA